MTLNILSENYIFSYFSQCFVETNKNTKKILRKSGEFALNFFFLEKKLFMKIRRISPKLFFLEKKLYNC